MHYVSLDIETTGLDPRTDQVLEVAMVLENTDDIKPIKDLPYARWIFKHPKIVGDHFATQLNRDLIEECQESGSDPEDAWASIEEWSTYRAYRDVPVEDKLFVAGKNVGSFDLQFFPLTIRQLFHHRTIDPGSVFIDWITGPKSLGELLGREVKHNALDDARAVIEILRRSYK